MRGRLAVLAMAPGPLAALIARAATGGAGDRTGLRGPRGSDAFPLIGHDLFSPACHSTGMSLFFNEIFMPG
jgi:hypothetical protein